MRRTALPRFYSFILLLCVAGLPSCVKENLDDCEVPDHNLILYFEYLDKEGNPLNEEGYEIFSTRLQTIDVLLFDAEETLYQWVSCDDIIINQNRRKELTVDPGEYIILGWANNISHRDDYQIGLPEISLANSYLYHDGEQTADPLHYAPDLRGLSTSSTENMGLYQVVVEKNKVTEHTLPFMSAHRTLNVYLRGFPEVDNDQENPIVSVSNITSWYDNFLGRGVENASFKIQAKEEMVFNNVSGDRELLGYAGFYIPHFDNENNIRLNINRPAVTINHEDINVTMKEILKKLELEVEDGDDLIINVLIELSDDGTYVQVKVPDWDKLEVDWK